MKTDLGFTFFINYHSVVTQVFPLNWLETSLVDEQERDNVFYRRKLNGTLTFGAGRISITEESGSHVVSFMCEDYDLFHDIEIADPYGRIDLLILKDLAVYYECYFSPANGTWDLNSKTFTVTPLPTDDYTDWDEGGDVEYSILNVTPEVTVNCRGYAYTHNRFLFDVIEYLADKVFPGCTVSSQFFTASTDYVTAQPSKLLYLTIAAKSDIKRPTASDRAWFANMSFNEMMGILKMFNCYWKYSATFNILTIEHLSWFENSTAGLDLRTQEIAKKLLKFKWDSDSMPKYERFSFMEHRSADFQGSIHYDSPAVDPAKSTEYSVDVTTDIELIQDTETIDAAKATGDEGFVMLANYKTGLNYYTYQGAGIVDSVVRFNMPLSWSYLLLSYHKHGRVLLDGFFNVTAQTFISAKKTIIHDINAINCAGYNPEDYITTELGEDYFGGLKGYVKKADIKPYGEINFTLMYGPADNANTGGPVYSKSLRVARDDLDVWSELSEPNIYDTYYSIWTNDDTCEVIMIPAGTQYQHDTLTQPNPIVTAKYNFTDSSLTGWTCTVDGSTTFGTCTDLDCNGGSPYPPAFPPDIPDIIGHTQGTTCGPVRVNWTSEANATYYVLQRNPDLGGNANWETQYTGTGLYYDDYNAGNQEGITFLYRVAAGNITVLSDWSAEHVVNDIMC